jgi:phytoene dehydrogenase-like protein
VRWERSRPSAGWAGRHRWPSSPPAAGTPWWSVPGHNGLTAAAYLARAGRACSCWRPASGSAGPARSTETWPGYRVSPCAYLAGLLHPLVIEELELRPARVSVGSRRRWAVRAVRGRQSVQLWEDDARCEAELAGLAPGDVAGYRAMSALKRRVVRRSSARPTTMTCGSAGPVARRAGGPRRARPGGARAAVHLVPGGAARPATSTIERLQSALWGQGVIGTNASPFDPGTASIHFHHSSGRIDPDRPACGASSRVAWARCRSCCTTPR